MIYVPNVTKKKDIFQLNFLIILFFMDSLNVIIVIQSQIIFTMIIQNKNISNVIKLVKHAMEVVMKI